VPTSGSGSDLRAALELDELHGHERGDVVLDQRQDFVSGGRLGDAERTVRSVLALVDRNAPADRSADEVGLPAVAERELALVLPADQQHLLPGRARDPPAPRLLRAATGVDDHAPRHNPHVDLTRGRAANLDL